MLLKHLIIAICITLTQCKSNNVVEFDLPPIFPQMPPLVKHYADNRFVINLEVINQFLDVSPLAVGQMIETKDKTALEKLMDTLNTMTGLSEECIADFLVYVVYLFICIY
jgi:hypothetical protein